MTVGTIGAGKSTCLGSLAYCIHMSPDIILEHDPENPEGYQMLMLNLVLRIERNEFPAETTKSTFQEIDISIGEHHDALLPLTLYELSGEDISVFDVLEHPVGSIPSGDFDERIMKAVHDMSVVVLVQPANSSGGMRWDAYFSQFLSKSRKMREKKNRMFPIPHLLIITKWDESPADASLEEYVMQHLPNTFKYLEDERWVSDFKCFSFSVGEVGEKDGNACIETFDPRDSMKIIEWMITTL